MYRLDEWLVKQGFFKSRKRAIKFIRDVGVRINGKLVQKPSYRISSNVNLVIDQNLVSHYNKPVGYHKLAYICNQLTETPFSSKDDCLDIGSNVGGFSQYLLEKSVHSVHAIEISPQFEAHLRQLHDQWPNKFSYQIVNYFEIAQTLPRKFTIITADMTIDPHFLLQNLKSFLLPLNEERMLRKIFITVKLGKNFINFGMISKIESKMKKLRPDCTIKWLDSLVGKQEKILLVLT